VASAAVYVAFAEDGFSFAGGGIVGFFRKSVSDQDWLLCALPIYESALPIVRTISEAFFTGYHNELNGAMGRVLDELPSLARQLSRLPNPESRAARIAGRNLKWSLNAYVRLAKELNGLSELSAHGLHQVVASRAHTGELLHSAHLGAIGAIAGNAAQLMGEAKDFFSGAACNTGVQLDPQ
jgi:hypothetical protein